MHVEKLVHVSSISCYACPRLGRNQKMSKLFKVCLKLQTTAGLLIQQAKVRRNSFITIHGHFYNQFSTMFFVQLQ